MSFNLWSRFLNWGSGRDVAGRARKPRAATRRRSFVPRLDALEDRTVPSTFTVSNLADSGPGSLRAAVTAANANPDRDRIVFASALSGTITLTSGQLDITEDVTIVGPGAKRLAVSGNDSSRVIEVSGAGTEVVLKRLKITRGLAGGQAPSLAGVGGGILNRATLTLTDVVVSRNRAVGDAAVTVPVHALFNIVGGAVGGGVANFGTLSVTGGKFTGNQALGADGADSSGSSFPGPAFAGNALGAALANFGTALVLKGGFTSNTAQAGDNGRGDFAGIGGGGAILNDTTLYVSNSSFQNNKALGGDNCISPSHNGHALGGAIMSGSLLPVISQGGASLSVTNSKFDRNEAVGGNGNTITDQVPPADGPNNGYGGGILVYQGSASINQSEITKNRAIGGAGGADQNGSHGVGGGVFFFNFIGGVTGSVWGSTIKGNRAVGGPGLGAGRGGDGLGGGVAAGGLGAPFGAPGTVSVIASVVDGNLARGGAGGPTGDGGDGLGGGLYNDTDSTMTVSFGKITRNEARGGTGVTAGLGIGGGVHNRGQYTDVGTVISGNTASSLVVPFQVGGGGTAPSGIPVIPGLLGPHNATGPATYLVQYTGDEGSFELLSFDPDAGSGTFRGSFVFVARNGDRLKMDYGIDPNNPGQFTLAPAEGDQVVVTFVAEFTPNPQGSTGRFASVVGGSFIMTAITAPFVPVPDEQGYTPPFDYTWTGQGTLEFAGV